MFEQIRDPLRRAAEKADYERLIDEIADTKERLRLAPPSEEWTFRQKLGKLEVDWYIARLTPLMSNMDNRERGIFLGVKRGRKNKGDAYRISEAQRKCLRPMILECQQAYDEALIE